MNLDAKLNTELLQRLYNFHYRNARMFQHWEMLWHSTLEGQKNKQANKKNPNQKTNHAELGIC